MMGFHGAHQRGAGSENALARVEAGRSVALAAIQGGPAFRARLASLGLVPGAVIRVVRNSPHGPFIIALKECRIVLGRGAANKLEIRQGGVPA